MKRSSGKIPLTLVAGQRADHNFVVDRFSRRPTIRWVITVSDEDDEECRRAFDGSKSSLHRWLKKKYSGLLIHARARLPSNCRPVLSGSDIVQTTMYRALRGFSKIRNKNPASANAWLLKIQNNHIVTQGVKFANEGHYRLNGPLESILTWAKMQHCLAVKDCSPSEEAIRDEQDTLIDRPPEGRHSNGLHRHLLGGENLSGGCRGAWRET
jgi:DNA-directed RNA polymerase specialized sigma24 family protein